MKKMIFFILMLTLTLSLFSTVYYVDSTHGNDAYGGTQIGPWEHISYAISQVAAGDTLMLSGTFYLTSDSGTTTDGIAITKNLTFIGEGARNTFIKAAATPGTATNRVFKINVGKIVTMKNLSIENGMSSANGGAIVNWNVLNLVDVNISNNQAADYGGAIFNYGNMTLNRVTIHDNNAEDFGGAIYSYGYFALNQSLTIENSTISGNSTTNESGGGILLFSFSQNRNVTINCVINSCTIANNTSGNSTANGLQTVTNQPANTALIELDIRNSVFDNGSANYHENTTGGGSVNTDRSFTFSSDGTLPSTNTYYDNIDCMLEPLAYNGGQTNTHEVNWGSILINSIPLNTGGDDYNGAPLTDQRGVGVSRGNVKDAGSYEFNSNVTFYLNSETGDDDSGNGLQSAPWEHLSKGITEVRDGDIIDMTGTFYMSEDPNVNFAVASGYVLGLFSEVHLIIQGQGADQTVIKAAPDGQQAESRLFVIYEGSDLTLRDISLQNGFDDSGAAIQARGDLVLENVMIHDCNTTEFQSGGAIYSNGGSIDITGSTIYDNYADNFGGGISLNLFNDTTTVNITNSTFARNIAEDGGGGAIHATISSVDSVLCELNININSCTFAYNEDHTFTGNFLVHNQLGMNSYVMTKINNSIITGPGNNFSGYSADYERNYTLNDDMTLQTTGQGNQNVDDCYLSELSDNGGGTLTYALMEGSPAIDAIPDWAGGGNYNGAELLDQRGVAIVNGNKDMGAYEGSIPYYLTSPEINKIDWDGILWIDWLPVERATNYAIYSSSDPYGTFTLETINPSEIVSWDKDASIDPMLFVTVTAIDTLRSKGIPRTIEIKKP